MKDIAIFGAGGFGREVACIIEQINQVAELDDFRYNLVGFFEDGGVIGRKISHFGEILGGMDELNAWPTDLAVCIAIGSPNAIRYVRSRITNQKVTFPNIIHPNFWIVDEQTFNIGQGNIINSNCKMSVDTSIGDFNILNGYIVMGHDAKVGNYNVLMPNVRVSGGVHINEGNLLGVSSVVLQQIQIGNGVRLGAGAILLTKPKDGGVYLGNPAKLFKY